MSASLVVLRFAEMKSIGAEILEVGGRRSEVLGLRDQVLGVGLSAISMQRYQTQTEALAVQVVPTLQGPLISGSDPGNA
eukprot:2723907-Rhodomonas_salina.2